MHLKIIFFQNCKIWNKYLTKKTRTNKKSKLGFGQNLMSWDCLFSAIDKSSGGNFLANKYFGIFGITIPCDWPLPNFDFVIADGYGYFWSY